MTTQAIDLDPLLEVDLDQPIEHVRSVPVDLGPNAEEALLLVHSATHFDPAQELHEDETLELTLVTGSEEVAWTIDLGAGVLPGIWFCPVFPFDLDDDGVEEIWHVDTADDAWHVETGAPERPMRNEVLTRRDATTGEVTGTWDWPWRPDEGGARAYRYFILGGHVDDGPVLVTAQGTYAEMELQAWTPEMGQRWTYHIPSHEGADAPESPGARGSHMTPVLDIDADGSDELLWGERLIDLDTGEEIWCADRDTWEGHSDIVLPTYHHEHGDWYVYTCREKETKLEDGEIVWIFDQSPRVATYDAAGDRIWEAVEAGHIHDGWTARVGDDRERVAVAVDVGASKDSLREFGWEAFTGTSIDWGLPVKSTLPVDVDGDGVHELVYVDAVHRADSAPERSSGELVNLEGRRLGRVDPNVASHQPSKLLDHPGEQIVSYTGDGTVRVWGDSTAEDTPEATARYEHPYYKKAQRLSAVGYNWRNVAGL
jgi:hypothetical protein